MTTDIDKCRRILETVQRTGNHLTVTFNYRSEFSKFASPDAELSKISATIQCTNS